MTLLDATGSVPIVGISRQEVKNDNDEGPAPPTEIGAEERGPRTSKLKSDQGPPYGESGVAAWRTMLKSVMVSPATVMSSTNTVLPGSL